MSMQAMRDLTSKQPTAILKQAYLQLKKKATHDAAEKLTLSVMAGELSQRNAEKARKMTNAQLRSQFIADMAMDYAAASELERDWLMSVSNELENRYPDAAKVANEWLDGLSCDEMRSMGPNAWEKKFMAAWPAE